jgi:AcrR family transcriptional regulator
MARRTSDPEREAGAAGGRSPDGATAPARRAPFSANPTVGSRGLRTQQRILDAALQVFGEHGYERSTLDKISQVAGCSRVSIYQYFSGKDDVFRHLAGQVARQMRASAEALAPLTPDEAGWNGLRAWAARYADIHARYEAVFRAFGTASQTDAELAGGSVRAGERNLALFESKLTTVSLPPRQLEPVVRLLHVAVTRTLDIGAILASAHPEAFGRDRLADAIADVIHRSLFGRVDGVNTRPASTERTPLLPLPDELLATFERASALEAESRQPGRRALASLLDVGHDVIVGRGFQGTRVDDVVAAAGVSHGAFYRYFRNMDDFVRIVAGGALAAVSTVLAQVPPGGDRPAMRRWLRRYNAVNAEKGAMIRVWAEAAEDPMWSDRSAAFDWGRRRLGRLLRDRPFGDHDAEAVMLLAVIETFGSIPRSATEVDAAMHVLERGFLGTD